VRTGVTYHDMARKVYAVKKSEREWIFLSSGVFASVLGAQVAEGGVVSLTPTPNTLSFTGLSVPKHQVQLKIGSSVAPGLGAFFEQYNTSSSAADKYLHPTNGFSWAEVIAGETIGAGTAFTPFLQISMNDDTVGKMIAFKSNGYYGWITENLGGFGGAITVTGAAYNNTQGGSIVAGDSSGSPVPEPTTAAIFALASLAMGAKGLRNRRINRLNMVA